MIKAKAAMILLLGLFIATVKALPLDHAEASEESLSNSDKDIKTQNSQESFSNAESNELNEENVESLETQLAEEDDAVADEAENHISKRSPYIPDPEPKTNAKSSESNSNEHATHDEYLEWIRPSTRYRRETVESEESLENEIKVQNEEDSNVHDDGVDDDDDDETDNEIEAHLKNDSLEGYAQGCEPVDEEPADINETTYNEEYERRKREASNEGDSSEERNESENSTAEENGEVSAEDTPDSVIVEAEDEDLDQ